MTHHLSPSCRPGWLAFLRGVPLAALFALSACGGGGGDAPPPAGGGAAPPPPSSAEAGTPEFELDAYAVNEGDGSVTITVKRFGTRTGAISATLLLPAGSSATAGADFERPVGTIEFAAGENGPKSITIGIADDAIAEGNETVQLMLSVSASETQGGVVRPSRSSTTITIVDNDVAVPLPTAVSVTANYRPKELRLDWTASANATSYKVMRAMPGGEFVQVGNDLHAGTLQSRQGLALHLLAPARPRYRIDACSASGCTPSTTAVTVDLMASLLATGYIKASDTTAGAGFGAAVAVSGDGQTVAIGAPGANGGAGAVYLYRRPSDGSAALGRTPTKIAAPSADAMRFGASVALNGNGSLLVIGAPDDSNSSDGDGHYPATPVFDRAASGGVFVYTLSAGTPPAEPEYFKRGLQRAGDHFGTAVSVSPEGLAIAVGAPGDDSANGFGTDQDAVDSGAVYLLRRGGAGDAWAWLPPIKARGPQIGAVPARTPQAGEEFGRSVSLSGHRPRDSDDNTPDITHVLAVGAPGSGGNRRGAAFVFREVNDTSIVYTAELQPPVRTAGDDFGSAVALSADGITLAVGAPGEDTAIEPQSVIGGGPDSGAVFIYQPLAVPMPAIGFVKGKYAMANSRYGSSLAINGTGDTLAVGSRADDSGLVAVDPAFDASAFTIGAGAVDLVRSGSGANWSAYTSPTAVARPLKAYVKASNTDGGDAFGSAVGLSANGSTLVVGAPGERSKSVNFNDPNRSETDNSLLGAGAAYLY